MKDINEPRTCAVRTRAYAGKPAALEQGGSVANAITSVTKDSMVMEPRIVGYSRDAKGNVVGHHLKDVANTLCPGNLGGTRNTAQYVAQPNFPVRCATAQGYAECPPGGVFDSAYPQSKLRRGRVQEGGTVTGALTAAGEFHCLYEGINQNQEDMEQNQPKYRIRKLTPRECFRLMDVEDKDIDRIQRAGISNSQQYKLAGNSIVVSCIYHIARKLFIDNKPTEPIQLSLFD